MTFVAGTVLTAAALNSELAAKTDLAMVQNAQTGSSYSYALADASKLLTMSNASANTVLVTKQATVTWVTGTQLRVMNLGAGVTTLVADTGVTINGNVSLKQYQGGTLIRTASDVWLFVPTASSSGMDLITPTSVAGSGVTLSGGQVSFSAATTVSVNGAFTAAYENYRVVLSLTAKSAGSLMYSRMRASGTDTSTSTYPYVYGRNASNGTNDSVGGTASQWSLYWSDASQPSQAILDLFRANSSGNVGMRGLSFGVDTAFVSYNLAGSCTQATAHDGLTVYPVSGNITGTLRIYGLRNS